MRAEFQKRPIITALIVVIGAVLLALFSDFFLVSFSWFVVYPLCLIGGAIWCGLAITAIVRLLVGLWRPGKRIRACLSSMILAFGLVTAAFAFWAISQLNLFFHFHKTQYEEAALLALRGELVQQGRDFQLPPRYWGLSVLKSVWLYRRGEATDVMFITAGFAGDVTGYVYSSDGKTPMPGAASRPISGAGKHWYLSSNEGCDINPEGLINRQNEIEQSHRADGGTADP